VVEVPRGNAVHPPFQGFQKAVLVAEAEGLEGQISGFVEEEADLVGRQSAVVHLLDRKERTEEAAEVFEAIVVMGPEVIVTDVPAKAEFFD
jgi:hypothetical protein